MTPGQALEILSNATSHLQLNRNDHQKIIEAIRVIEIALSPKVESE